MVEKDVAEACRVVYTSDDDPRYSGLYFCSNENLERLFSFVNVSGKDVLTVLGSSDQLFHSIYHGAKSVDTFDINKLTKYYYYLRRWTLLYCGMYYPPERWTRQYDFIVELLKLVECRSEEEKEAYDFWSLYLQRTGRDMCGNLFYLNPCDHTVIGMDYLKRHVGEYTLNFQNEDFFGKMKSDKQYDVIFASNILEYSNGRASKIKQSVENLKSLLKDDGIVVCSHLIHTNRDRLDDYYPGDAYYLREFEREDFPSSYDYYYQKDCSIGYVYRKIGRDYYG